LARAVKELTAGRGAEFVLEFTGVPEAMEAGFELLRFGGRFVMAGATFPSGPIALDAEQLVRRMIRLQGVYNYEAQDLKAAVAFLSGAMARYPFADLIGRSFRLEEIQEAFDYAEKVKPPRVALRPF
jgi:alcohol dehydrogenase